MILMMKHEFDPDFGPFSTNYTLQLMDGRTEGAPAS
jgi:hypothetical protein